MNTAKIVLIILFQVASVFAARADEADDFRAAMEANNAKWLQAYNAQDAKALGAMYAEDALLIAAGAQPIRGAKDIEAYWRADVRDYREHTWVILETRSDNDLAYQVAEWTVVARSGGQEYSGNTVRLLERQPDGRWLTNIHMFSVHE
jgi:uncharacterized protein (TIGR02246 family)